MNAAKRAAIYQRFAAADPSPATELVYDGAFQLLAAVILSAQATDRSVNLATAGLFDAAPTPAAMLALGEAGVGAHVCRVNLWRTKARNLIKTCELLIERHGGEVPRSREVLEALPGVGRKTANVVLNVAFGEPTVAVDTHIFRVANRTRLAPGKDVRAVEERLLKCTPLEFRLHAHHWLILHGRYVCMARRPACGRCPIHDLCEYPDKTPPAATGVEVDAGRA